jgi:glucokinase-like ROK family protein
MPGLVDAASGTLLVAPNLGWTDVPVRELLQEHFDFPIFVGNEANLAALGETYFGAAAGFNHVLYLSSGVGLGGGIVLNGQIMTGTTGFSGEIGHMTLVAEDGLPCNCGNTGCWETVANQWAVFRYVEEAIQRGQASSLQEVLSRPPYRLTIPNVVQAAKAGDAVAIAALEETGRWLGIGLANLINALNPQRVVFGGILSLAHDFLMPVIRSTVARRAWRYSYEACDIVIAENGADACVFGGVAAVYHQFLSEPQAFHMRGGRWLKTIETR